MRATDPPVRVCFVCLGNICRSPTAMAIMRHLVTAAGLEEHVVADSAGTGAWHVGDPPDRRAAAEARRRGVELSHRGQQFRRGDFARFDYVVAMDAENHAALESLAGPADLPKLHLLRHFDPASSAGPVCLDVPDPYYGGPGGFAEVFDLCDAACRGLLETLRARHGLP